MQASQNPTSQGQADAVDDVYITLMVATRSLTGLIDNQTKGQPPSSVCRHPPQSLSLYKEERGGIWGARKTRHCPLRKPRAHCPPGAPARGAPIMAHSFKPGWFPPNMLRLLFFGYWVPRIGPLSQPSDDGSSTLAVAMGLDVSFWGFYC